MKYVDAELLLKEIERHLERATAEQEKFPDMPKYRWYLREGKKELCNDLLDYMYDTLGVEEPITDSLQQEQPEVDLDADIEMEWDSFNKHLAEYAEEPEEVVWLNWLSFIDVARHFYELGFNARKEE